MIRRCVLVALLFCAAGIMAAQEIPKFDLFGGYSYGRIKTNNFSSRGNFNGWDSSLTYNVNRWLGIVAEGSGHYDSRAIAPALVVTFVCPVNQTCPPPNTFGPVDLNRKVHTYVFGPRFTWRTGHVVTPFAHILAGGGYAIDTTHFGAPTRFDSTLHSGAFVWKAGGGIDLRMNSLVSWRTQIDLIHSHFSFEKQNNFQVSTGPVFHFGSK